MINAGAWVNLNHLSREEQSSCCPMQLMKSRIMIQSNLSMQIHMGIKNSITKSSKFQIYYSFNIETELDKILSKLDLQHQESRESDVEKYH